MEGNNTVSIHDDEYVVIKHIESVKRDSIRITLSMISGKEHFLIFDTEKEAKKAYNNIIELLNND